MPTIVPDAFDLKILSHVQINNQRPHREIAEDVGLSATAVTRRLGRLRENGIIKQDISVLDAAALGRPLTIIAHVTALSEEISKLDSMRQLFTSCDQVQQCFYVTGDSDFVLVINVADMSEYEQLTRRLFFEPGNVDKFTTNVAMETLKTGALVKL